jgi:hypothetical protein
MRTDANLRTICDTLQKNCGDLHEAARAAGLSPNFIMQWLRDDPEATKLVDEAQRVGWLRLESVAIKRATEGVEHDVYYKGDVVGQKTEYSDSLLVKVMEARIPAYKKGDGGNTFNGPTQVNIMPRAENFDEWLAMKDTVLQRRAVAELPAPSALLPDILVGDYIEVVPNILEGLL